jgi:hypothetical protein
MILVQGGTLACLLVLWGRLSGGSFNHHKKIFDQPLLLVNFKIAGFNAALRRIGYFSTAGVEALTLLNR